MPFSPTGAGGGSIAFGVTGPGPLVDNAIPRMHGVTGLIIQAYTSNTPTISDSGVPTFPAMVSGGASLSSFIMADNTGAQSAPATPYVDPAFTGVALGKIAHNSLVLSSQGLGVSFTRTTQHGALPLAQIFLSVSPTGAQSGNDSNTALQIGTDVDPAATQTVQFTTGLDAFNRVRAAVTVNASVGVSGWANVEAGATITSGVIGGAFTANMTNVGASSPYLCGVGADMANGVDQKGVIGNLYAFDAINVSTGQAVSVARRAAYNADAYPTVAIGGGATTTPAEDWGLRMAVIAPSAIAGKLALGGVFVPTTAIEFVKEVAAIIGVARSTTAATLGAGLVLAAGGATSGSTDKNGGALTLASGQATGAGTSSVQIITTGTTGAGSGTGDAAANTVFTATANRIAFFGATTVIKQTSGANLTNNVTAGGTDNTIDNVVADGTIATAADLVTTRNAVYQLARKLKQINDGLRSYGLFT